MNGNESEHNEAGRLCVLRQYGIDETLSDAGLDRIVALTARIFQVPTASISLVEAARQVFVSKVGTDLCETERESSFCAHALGARAILEVPDATRDPRFCDNRLVTGPPHIRFYAGCPLIAPQGHVLGALCIIDDKARAPLSQEGRTNLRDLAALVMDRLELRRLDIARQVGSQRFEKMAAVSPDAIVCLDGQSRITFWNPAAQRLFGYDRDTMLGATMDKVASPQSVRELLALAEDESSLSVGRSVDAEIRSASGVWVPVEISTSMWREAGQANFCTVLRDATERRQNERRLYRLAHIDALTDLPNRILFRERVQHALASGGFGALMMVDLDGFKNVNDSFGHGAGDAMLAAVAQRLRACVPETVTAARMGGDEFALILPGGDVAQLEALSGQIIETLSGPVVLEGEPVSVGASVGIARYPCDGTTFSELLSSADLALYEAKASGKHCSRFYSSRLRDVSLARQAYQTELPRALDAQEWTLYYEPVVRLADGALTAMDAQLRWKHPEQGVLEFAQFASALHSSPLAAKVGDQMLSTACAQLAVWRSTFPDLRVSMALLDAQFRRSDLALQVQAYLNRHQLPGSALELEITEAILMREDVQTTATLDDLRRLDVGISLANYGTGNMSLERIKRAPLTRLKIDPTFIGGMFESRADAAIIRIVLYLGESLGLSVTAKGVTSQAHYDRLLKKGCEQAQGPWVGEAAPAAPLDKWIQA